MNTQHLTNGTLGAGDGDILVTLKLDHRPTADYVRALRRNLPRLFPAATFYTLPADITTQILNFGCPRDRPLQIEGNDAGVSKAQADKILDQLRQGFRITDLRIQQPFELSRSRWTWIVQRLRKADTPSRRFQSVLNTLSGSFRCPCSFSTEQHGGL